MHIGLRVTAVALAGSLLAACGGDGGADSQHKRKNRGKGEAGVAENLPERETEILKKYLHHRLLSWKEGKDETAD